MCKCSRITLRQRELIGRFREAELKQTAIARLLRVHPSTICRELKRNIYPRLGYNIYYADDQKI